MSEAVPLQPPPMPVAGPVLVVDSLNAYYGRAQRVRTKVAEDFSSAFQSVDLIVSPTSPTIAFKLGERTSDPLSMYLSDYCTVPMSLAGIPAISIPCGFTHPSFRGCTRGLSEKPIVSLSAMTHLLSERVAGFTSL